MAKHLLENGGRVLFWREPRPERELLPSDGVLSAFGYLGAALLLSFLLNGVPGHIDWLLLPDSVFPVMVLGVSAWLLSLLTRDTGLLLPVFLDMVNARTLVLCIECLLVLLFKDKPGAEESFALFQQGLELWWILAGLVRYGRYASVRVLPTLLAWATFFIPWLLFLSAYPAIDVWQAEGLDTDPHAVVESMTEDVFSAEPALLEDALNDLQSERPGVEDLYFLGVAGNGYRALHRREVDLVDSVLKSDFDTVGRSVVLANGSGHEIHAPFATHSNLEASLNQFSEVMDAEDDILFLFISSEGLPNHHLRLAEPGLLIPDLKPSDLKELLDETKITWRIIVVSGCYSGGFIEALHDSHTLIMTATGATGEGLGCLQADQTSWFVQALFGEALKKTKSLPEAFRLASERLQQQAKAAGKPFNPPEMDIGAEIVQKLESLQRRLEKPGGSDSGVRASLPSSRFVRHEALDQLGPLIL